MLTNTRNIKYRIDPANAAPGMCILIRRQCKAAGEDIAGKNICVIEYQPSWQPARRYAVATSDGRGGDHSEPKAFAALRDAMGNNGTVHATILSVYTERAPCQNGAGMKNCDQYLWDVFRGVRLPDNFTAGQLLFPLGGATPVFYSFMYPSGGQAELDNAMAQLAAVGITDDPNDTTTKRLRDFLRDEGRSERERVTQILRQAAFTEV